MRLQRRPSLPVAHDHGRSKFSTLAAEGFIGLDAWLAFDPPQRLAFTWGPDELHLALEAVDGGCRLQLLNVLAERDTAARNSTGWTACLWVLDRLIAGEDVTGPHGDGVPPFQPIYDSYVAAGLPSGAEIPGADD